MAAGESTLREALRDDEEELVARRATTQPARRRVKAKPGPVLEVQVTRGSGNVFADLGFPNPEEHLAKAQLVLMIGGVIRDRRLTQHDAAALMGIDQPKVSNLLRGGFRGFSTHRLMEFLNALGRDVDIVVRAAPKSRKRGRLHVGAA